MVEAARCVEAETAITPRFQRKNRYYDQDLYKVNNLIGVYLII